MRDFEVLSYQRIETLTIEVVSSSSVLLDSINIFEDFFKEINDLKLFAVKYIVLYRDRQVISNYYTAENYSKAEEVLKELSSIEYYLLLFNLAKKVLKNENLTILKLKNFKGFLFPLRPEEENLSAIYDWIDTNNIVIAIKTRQKCLLIMAQPYYSGWRVEILSGNTRIEVTDYNGTTLIRAKSSCKFQLSFREYDKTMRSFITIYGLVIPLSIITGFYVERKWRRKLEH